MKIIFIRLCDGAFCPSAVARGKAANILAVCVGLAIVVGVLVWLNSKRSH